MVTFEYLHQLLLPLHVLLSLQLSLRVFTPIELIEPTTLSLNPIDALPEHGIGKGILLIPTQRPLLLVTGWSRLSARRDRRRRLLVDPLEHVPILAFHAEALRPGLVGDGRRSYRQCLSSVSCGVLLGEGVRIARVGRETPWLVAVVVAAGGGEEPRGEDARGEEVPEAAKWKWRGGGGGRGAGGRSYGLEAVPEVAGGEEEAAEQHGGARRRAATIRQGRGARVLV